MTSTHETRSGITYERAGGRGSTPVVFIHAGIADRRMWDPQWTAFTQTHDCLRLDLRGFGTSNSPPTIELDYVADLLEVLDAEGIARCHLVAASLGAGVAVETTLGRPGLAESLLLCPPGGSLLAERTPDLAAFFEAESAALAADDLDRAVAANIDAWVIGNGRTAEDVDPALVERVSVMQRRAFEVQQTWDDDLPQAEMNPPALERLPEVAAPTLVVVGAHDLLTTLDAARRVSEGLPHVRLLTWPDAAHLPSLEHPERFNDALTDWLTTV